MKKEIKKNLKLVITMVAVACCIGVSRTFADNYNYNVNFDTITAVLNTKWENLDLKNISDRDIKAKMIQKQIQTVNFWVLMSPEARKIVEEYFNDRSKKNEKVEIDDAEFHKINKFVVGQSPEDDKGWMFGFFTTELDYRNFVKKLTEQDRGYDLADFHFYEGTKSNASSFGFEKLEYYCGFLEGVFASVGDLEFLRSVLSQSNENYDKARSIVEKARQSWLKNGKEKHQFHWLKTYIDFKKEIERLNGYGGSIINVEDGDQKDSVYRKNRKYMSDEDGAIYLQMCREHYWRDRLTLEEKKIAKKIAKKFKGDINKITDYFDKAILEETDKEEKEFLTSVQAFFSEIVYIQNVKKKRNLNVADFFANGKDNTKEIFGNPENIKSYIDLNYRLLDDDDRKFADEILKKYKNKASLAMKKLKEYKKNHLSEHEYHAIEEWLYWQNVLDTLDNIADPQENTSKVGRSSAKGKKKENKTKDTYFDKDGWHTSNRDAVISGLERREREWDKLNSDEKKFAIEVAKKCNGDIDKAVEYVENLSKNESDSEKANFLDKVVTFLGKERWIQTPLHCYKDAMSVEDFCAKGEDNTEKLFGNVENIKLYIDRNYRMMFSDDQKLARKILKKSKGNVKLALEKLKTYAKKYPSKHQYFMIENWLHWQDVLDTLDKKTKTQKNTSKIDKFQPEKVNSEDNTKKKVTIAERIENIEYWIDFDYKAMNSDDRKWVSDILKEKNENIEMALEEVDFYHKKYPSEHQYFIIKSWLHLKRMRADMCRLAKLEELKLKLLDVN